jgi:hypothetical protein
MTPTQIESQPSRELSAATAEIGPGEIAAISGILSPTAEEKRSEQRQFLLCEHCQAPVDGDQRYCVSCGARQSHARNPATTYFATAARSRRAGATQRRAEGVLHGPLFTLLLVLLPLGVAAGVLVGRGGAGNNDGKLIAALQKQPVITAAPSGGAAAAQAGSDASAGNLPSDFSLSRGFTVKLSTLPFAGTDAAAVARAEQEAGAKGARKVGLINPKDFKTTPNEGASDYIVYSGEFKTRAEAEKALAKLKSKFPAAQVIAVAPAASAAAPVLAHTAYGTVHKIAGSRPTPRQIQQDKQIVQKIHRTVGKSYVNAQKGLPDTITVGGSSGGGSAPSQSAAEKAGEH